MRELIRHRTRGCARFDCSMLVTGYPNEQYRKAKHEGCILLVPTESSGPLGCVLKAYWPLLNSADLSTYVVHLSLSSDMGAEDITSLTNSEGGSSKFISGIQCASDESNNAGWRSASLLYLFS